jgi:hypothetical protein
MDRHASRIGLQISFSSIALPLSCRALIWDQDLEHKKD